MPPRAKAQKKELRPTERQTPLGLFHFMQLSLIGVRFISTKCNTSQLKSV